MNDDDTKAMCELAAEMDSFEALRFIRSETGEGFRTAKFIYDSRVLPLKVAAKVQEQTK